MPSRRVLLVGFGVIVCGVILLLGWQRAGTNSYQAVFLPGGNIDLDLSAGGYEIRGTSENQIRVEIDQRDLSAAHSEVHVTGNMAKVRVDGPADNFHAIIYVPQHANLKANQTIGELRIINVEGDKYVGLNIGQIRIDMPSTEKIRSVDAAVTIGSVRAGPWQTSKGGFFRSFRAGGQGNYTVNARLDIGDIELN
jgi:hypothetical protein